MADYWKSQAKKFCDFCKCWIADNKPSVEFHEKGKRHKENVAIRLKNISTQSIKDQKAKRKMDEDIKRMEKAALEAYLKDVESNADYSSQLLNEQLSERNSKVGNSSTSVCGTGSGESSCKETKKSEPKVAAKVWYEAHSDEGYTYYWNTETEESVWEPPEDGYVTLEEQQKLAEAESKREAKKKIIESKQNEEKEKMKQEECRAYLEREKMRSKAKVEEPETKHSIPIGPAPKANPYGSWTTVKVCKRKSVDLQLPEQKKIEYKVPVASSSEIAVKFKEKSIDTLETEDSSGNFKKRKINMGSRQNMRQRVDDE